MAVSPWQNQIVGYGEEPPESLLANPKNIRIHPKPQQDALSGSLSEIGWIAPVIVNRTTAHVVDGHARIELAISRGEPSVPIAYVEITPEQEALALAAFDPIGAMAAVDAEKLDELLREVSTGDAALQAMLDQLAQSAGVVPSYQDADPAGVDQIPEQYQILIDCTSESEQAALLDRFAEEGIRCRALVS